MTPQQFEKYIKDISSNSDQHLDEFAKEWIILKIKKAYEDTQNDKAFDILAQLFVYTFSLSLLIYLYFFV